jgi:hypothetical protein
MRAWIVAGLICGLFGCSGKDQAPSEPVAAPAELSAQPAEPPLPPAAAEPPPAPRPITVPGVLPDHIGYPKEGWSKVRLEDEVPICMFETDLERQDAGFPEKVKKKPKLKADAPLVFGAFAATCISDGCDDLASLQCWVDREGSTLVVHSRYSGYHKDGSRCGQPCRKVDAGCETPPLEAGTYTVKHGSKTTQLKIPGAVKSACLK